MSYPFQLKPLLYEHDVLEPFIDAETMYLHHDKHLRTYVDNLNKALELHPEFHSWTLEQLLMNLKLLPNDIRTMVQNNGGGVYNHNLFFELLKRDTKPSQTEPLFKAIIDVFGGIMQMEVALKKAALSVFGSGWAWLVADADGRLSILTTANQDIIDLYNFIPIINLDVWEHAYYLKNQNRRAEYIDKFFKVINWEEAERNYAKI